MMMIGVCVTLKRACASYTYVEVNYIQVQYRKYLAERRHGDGRSFSECVCVVFPSLFEQTNWKCRTYKWWVLQTPLCSIA
jgi:hypothetical protein